MNKKIQKHLQDYCKRYEWSCETPDEYLETLRECGEELYRKKVGGSRWWDTYFCVTCIDGMEIGYYDAATTGDRSPQDVGWEFEMNDICDVEKHEEVKVITTYIPRKNE